MAYDEKLAERLSKTFSRRKGAKEKKMFGGIAYIVNGHMCCGIVKDMLVVRVGPDAYEEALEEKHTRPMDFTYIESFKGSFRDECLNTHWFLSLYGAREKIENWRRDYYELRPYLALDNMTPEEYMKKPEISNLPGTALGSGSHNLIDSEGKPGPVLYTSYSLFFNSA